MLRCHLLASGRVQGVGFRWFVREQASRCGLSGWVRNEYDGTVTIEVQGGEDSIEVFLSILRQGNSWIDIWELRVESMLPIPEESGFHIHD